MCSCLEGDDSKCVLLHKTIARSTVITSIHCASLINQNDLLSSVYPGLSNVQIIVIKHDSIDIYAPSSPVEEEEEEEEEENHFSQNSDDKSHQNNKLVFLHSEQIHCRIQSSTVIKSHSINTFSNSSPDLLALTLETGLLLIAKLSMNSNLKYPVSNPTDSLYSLSVIYKASLHPPSNITFDSYSSSRLQLRNGSMIDNRTFPWIIPGVNTAVDPAGRAIAVSALSERIAIFSGPFAKQYSSPDEYTPLNSSPQFIHVQGTIIHICFLDTYNSFDDTLLEKKNNTKTDVNDNSSKNKKTTKFYDSEILDPFARLAVLISYNSKMYISLFRWNTYTFLDKEFENNNISNIATYDINTSSIEDLLPNDIGSIKDSFFSCYATFDLPSSFDVPLQMLPVYGNHAIYLISSTKVHLISEIALISNDISQSPILTHIPVPPSSSLDHSSIVIVHAYSSLSKSNSSLYLLLNNNTIEKVDVFSDESFTPPKLSLFPIKFADLPNSLNKSAPYLYSFFIVEDSNIKNLPVPPIIDSELPSTYYNSLQKAQEESYDLGVGYLFCASDVGSPVCLEYPTLRRLDYFTSSLSNNAPVIDAIAVPDMLLHKIRNDPDYVTKSKKVATTADVIEPVDRLFTISGFRHTGSLNQISWGKNAYTLATSFADTNLDSTGKNIEGRDQGDDDYSIFKSSYDLQISGIKSIFWVSGIQNLAHNSPGATSYLFVSYPWKSKIYRIVSTVNEPMRLIDSTESLYLCTTAETLLVSTKAVPNNPTMNILLQVTSAGVFAILIDDAQISEYSQLDFDDVEDYDTGVLPFPVFSTVVAKSAAEFDFPLQFSSVLGDFFAVISTEKELYILRIVLQNDIDEMDDNVSINSRDDANSDTESLSVSIEQITEGIPLSYLKSDISILKLAMLDGASPNIACLLGTHRPSLVFYLTKYDLTFEFDSLFKNLPGTPIPNDIIYVSGVRISFEEAVRLKDSKNQVDGDQKEAAIYTCHNLLIGLRDGTLLQVKVISEETAILETDQDSNKVEFNFKFFSDLKFANAYKVGELPIKLFLNNGLDSMAEKRLLALSDQLWELRIKNWNLASIKLSYFPINIESDYSKFRSIASLSLYNTDMYLINSNSKDTETHAANCPQSSYVTKFAIISKERVQFFGIKEVSNCAFKKTIIGQTPKNIVYLSHINAFAISLHTGMNQLVFYDAVSREKLLCHPLLNMGVSNTDDLENSDKNNFDYVPVFSSDEKITCMSEWQTIVKNKPFTFLLVGCSKDKSNYSHFHSRKRNKASSFSSDCNDGSQQIYPVEGRVLGLRISRVENKLEVRVKMNWKTTSIVSSISSIGPRSIIYACGNNVILRTLDPLLNKFVERASQYYELAARVTSLYVYGEHIVVLTESSSFTILKFLEEKNGSSIEKLHFVQSDANLHDVKCILMVPIKNYLTEEENYNTLTPQVQYKYLLLAGSNGREIWGFDPSKGISLEPVIQVTVNSSITKLLCGKFMRLWPRVNLLKEGLSTSQKNYISMNFSENSLNKVIGSDAIRWIGVGLNGIIYDFNIYESDDSSGIESMTELNISNESNNLDDNDKKTGINQIFDVNSVTSRALNAKNALNMDYRRMDNRIQGSDFYNDVSFHF